MKTRNIFKVAAIMALVLFASCSKEEIKDSQSKDVITLEASALQALGENGQTQSRISFDIPSDGSVPKVSWVEGDIIYIGYINPTGTSGLALSKMLDDGNFTTFKCVKVDKNTNIATFEGTSIIENANIAIYTQIPEKVYSFYKDSYQYGVRCSVGETPISGDNSHLAKNDLLVSTFNTTDKKLNFKRVFGLVKFEFTLPESVSGVGTFSCDKLKLVGTANITTSTGDFAPNSTSTALTLNDISVNGSLLTFYTLTPRVNNRKKPTITYTFQINDKTYSASVTYENDALIRENKATKISATLTEQPAQ